MGILRHTHPAGSLTRGQIDLLAVLQNRAAESEKDVNDQLRSAFLIHAQVVVTFFRTTAP